MLPPEKEKRKKGNRLIAGIRTPLLCAALFFFCLQTGCREEVSPPEKPGGVRQKIARQDQTDKKHAGSEDALVPSVNTLPLSEEFLQPTTRLAVEQQGRDHAIDPDTEREPYPPSPYSYDPKEKIDPFMPVLGARLDSGSPVPKKRAKRAAPLTPLQKIDINQMKLVAVITAPTGNRAMVEDASGKGYLISKGTYIGTNFGKVVRILTDKVVVQEDVKDIISGKVIVREVTLELPPKYESGSMQ
jgi:type IV pilus assembly protein PilP